ncbi:outer membrane receptor protein involved in Fe transport [Sphingobium xanthum]|uniref:TonB-dependent receptor n=1 Tax=Sphingobium xanthum TaxID=1387165 RepID=UPI001C8B63DC|nr:TonB-dependent receptor [Sphingobium xanthum]
MRSFLAAVGLSAICLSGSAVAQTAQTPDSADAAEGTGDEIVVTGEKVARSLQDTTASVAVTTAKRVVEENLVSLQDVLQRTANVTETYGVSGFTIRGIANRGVTGGEGAALATIFVDGAALPSALVQSAPTDMWDVAQVEILRGPQSTLQGLNALAGAIIVQTTEPTMDWSVRVRAMVTDETATQFAIAGGGAIIPGELAFRVSAEKRDGDGLTYNPTRKTDENPLDSINLRGKLLWTPTALPGFEARLGYTRFERFGGYSFSYTDTSVTDYFGNRRNFSNDPNDSDLTTDIATGDLRYDFGGGFSLTSLSTYNIVNEFNRYDNDLTAAANGAYTQRNRYKTFSQELRLNYESDRVSALFGGFFYDRSNQIRTTSITGVTTPVSTIAGLLQLNGLDATTANFVANLYGTALPRIPVDFKSDGSGKVQTLAVFADGRIKLTDRLSLLAGFRYDHEKNSIAVKQVTGLAGPLPNPLLFGPAGSPLNTAVIGINAAVTGFVAQASGGAVAIDRTFDAFLPKGGIEMAWTDDIKTAFTVQRGYRSGGSSSNLARSATFAYNPEFTWNYELSFRSQWLDRTLTLNANVYYVDWKDQQVSANFGLNEYDTNIVNAGKSHLYGFEIEAAHRPSDKFDWYASIGHGRTKFDAFTTTIGSVTDFSGLEFQHAPNWTLAAGVNVRPLDGLRFNLNASHRSAVFSEITRPQTDARLASRTLVNARIGYDIGPFTLSAFASNIFDEQYFQYARVGLPRGVMGAPRVLGAAIEVQW